MATYKSIKMLRDFLLAVSIFTAIFVIIPFIHVKPETIKQNGKAYQATVENVYWVAPNGPGSNTGGSFVDLKLKNGEMVKRHKINGKTKNLLSIGEELKVYRYENRWFILKYGESNPPPLWPPATVLIILLAIIMVLNKYMKKSGFRGRTLGPTPAP